MCIECLEIISKGESFWIPKDKWHCFWPEYVCMYAFQKNAVLINNILELLFIFLERQGAQVSEGQTEREKRIPSHAGSVLSARGSSLCSTYAHEPCLTCAHEP